MIFVGPKGIPQPIVKKIGETLKKVSESPEFQNKLASADLPYDFKDQAQLEKEIPQLYESGKKVLDKMGVKKGE